MVGKLENALGTIIISNAVIAKLAGIVANNCYGVVGMAYRNTADGLVNLLKSDRLSKGVKVDMIEGSLSIALHIMVEYGVNINATCKSIINNVTYQVKNMTGFEVKDVHVFVESIRVDE